MASKRIVLRNSDEVLQHILQGAKKAYETITDTMGPGGGCVLSSTFDTISITKDGATVAERIADIAEKEELFGVEFIRAASRKMGEVVGDGTTTVTAVLYKMMETALSLRRMGLAIHEIVEALERISVQSKRIISQHLKGIEATSAEMQRIANIAANGDEKTGKLLAELFNRLGKESIILVEESKDGNTSIDLKEGFYFNSGPASTDFFKRKIEGDKKNRIVLEKARVLVFDHKLSTLSSSLLKLLNTFHQSRENLLIVAEDFSNEFLEIITRNVILGTLNCICVKAPGFGTKKSELLEDLALITGSTLLKDSLKDELAMAYVGTCEKVIILKDSTNIYGRLSSEELDYRVQQLSEHLNSLSAGYEKDQLRERLARLTKGIGIFFAGCGSNEVGLKEYKERVDDAINACFNALRFGILPGAGNDFLLVKRHLIDELRGEQSTVADAMRRLMTALENPARIIVQNTEKASPDIILARLAESMNDHLGFDGVSGDLVNLMEKGIINPASVAWNAIQIACETAINFIRCKAVLLEQKQEEEKDSSSAFTGY